MDIDEINTFLENDFSSHVTNILKIKNNFKNDPNEVNKKKIELLIKFINVFEMKCSLIENEDICNNKEINDDEENNLKNDETCISEDNSEDNKDEIDGNDSDTTESLSDCEYDDDHDDKKDIMDNIFKRARLGLESARDNKGFSIEKKNNYSLVE